MLTKIGVVTLAVGLLVSACSSTPQQTAGPTGLLTAAPSSQTPTATASQPAPTPPPTPGSPGPSTSALPEPQLASVDEIVAAMAQPEMAEQAVVSMLAALNIGLYQDDGKLIRRGLEQSDDDYYAYESEARGLVQRLRAQHDPEQQVSWQEYHAALAGLGLQSSADELRQAYSTAYASLPDEPITRFVLAQASMDAEGQITPLGVWLLFLDGVIPGFLSTQAIALVGGSMIGTGPLVAAGTQRAGVAARNLAELWPEIESQLRRNLQLMRAMTLIDTSTISVEVVPAAVHEGHGGNSGTPTTVTATVKPCGGVSPFSGNCSLPLNRVLSGINVTWEYPGALTDHGTATATSGRSVATNDEGRVSFTFTPTVEEANGQGTEEEIEVEIKATVSKLDVAQRIYQIQIPLGVLLGKSVNTSHAQNLTVGWHELPLVPVTISWTDVYDGVLDTITFEGKLDKIDTVNCPPGLTCLTGEGTASGSRAGWKGCNPGIDVIPEGNGKASFFGTIDGDRIAIGAFANIDNPLSGVTTAVFDVDLSGGTDFIEASEPVGDLCPRYSYGTLILKQIDAPLP